MTDTTDDWAAALEGPPRKPMKRSTKIFLWLFAALVAWLTLSNASWLADNPAGKRTLIAHRGAAQLFDHRGIDRDSCTATRIHTPEHGFIENSLTSMKVAVGLGAGMVELDIAPTKDGQLAVFHDWTLDCRTDGKGAIRDATMAELRRLDIGHGYTPDGGKTFPFRGKGVGMLPSFDEVLDQLGHNSLMINFKANDAREAEMLLAAFARAGIDPNDPRFGFYGKDKPIAVIRAKAPKAWALDPDSAKTCTRDYLKYGWSGWYPPSCTDNTIMVPLNYQWAYWGWPARLQARAAEHGTRVLLVGNYGDEANGLGLYDPRQLTKVPADFTGYIWVEDIYNIGPALRPRQK